MTARKKSLKKRVGNVEFSMLVFRKTGEPTLTNNNKMLLPITIDALNEDKRYTAGEQILLYVPVSMKNFVLETHPAETVFYVEKIGELAVNGNRVKELDYGILE